jgi:hypothetical protein
MYYFGYPIGVIGVIYGAISIAVDVKELITKKID